MQRTERPCLVLISGNYLGIEDKIESSSVMFHQKAIEASVLNSQKDEGGVYV